MMEAVATIDQASKSAVFTIRQWSIITALYGLLTMIGGPQRWGGRAFQLLNFVPGQSYTVGSIMFAGGAMVTLFSFTAGHTGDRRLYRARNMAMTVCQYLCFALAAAFMVAGFIDSKAPLGGWLFIAGVGLQFRVLRRLRSKVAADDAPSG